MKKVLSIIFILIIVLSIFAPCVNAVQQSDLKFTKIKDKADDFINSGDKQYINEDSLKVVSNNIAKILFSIGIVVSVVVFSVLGIKYMVGAADEKAEIKKTLIPFTVGFIVIVGSVLIWQTAISIMQGNETPHVPQQESAPQTTPGGTGSSGSTPNTNTSLVDTVTTQTAETVYVGSNTVYCGHCFEEIGIVKNGDKCPHCGYTMNVVISSRYSQAEQKAYILTNETGDRRCGHCMKRLTDSEVRGGTCSGCGYSLSLGFKTCCEVTTEEVVNYDAVYNVMVNGFNEEYVNQSISNFKNTVAGSF